MDKKKLAAEKEDLQAKLNVYLEQENSKASSWSKRSEINQATANQSLDLNSLLSDQILNPKEGLGLALMSKDEEIRILKRKI